MTRYIIEAARIAQRRSNSVQVRAFAGSMAADARVSEATAAVAAQL